MGRVDLIQPTKMTARILYIYIYIYTPILFLQEDRIIFFSFIGSRVPYDMCPSTIKMRDYRSAPGIEARALHFGSSSGIKSSKKVSCERGIESRLMNEQNKPKVPQVLVVNQISPFTSILITQDFLLFIIDHAGSLLPNTSLKL